MTREALATFLANRLPEIEQSFWVEFPDGTKLPAVIAQGATDLQNIKDLCVALQAAAERIRELESALGE